MPLICLVASTDWDFPIFKILANNDTGAAAGHQGGVVIPKDLRVYFPDWRELRPRSARHLTVGSRLSCSSRTNTRRA